MFSHNLWRVASLFVDAGTHRKIVMGTGRAPARTRMRTHSRRSSL